MKNEYFLGVRVNGRLYVHLNLFLSELIQDNKRYKLSPIFPLRATLKTPFRASLQEIVDFEKRFERFVKESSQYRFSARPECFEKNGSTTLVASFCEEVKQRLSQISREITAFLEEEFPSITHVRVPGGEKVVHHIPLLKGEIEEDLLRFAKNSEGPYLSEFLIFERIVLFEKKQGLWREKSVFVLPERSKVAVA